MGTRRFNAAGSNAVRGKPAHARKGHYKTMDYHVLQVDPADKCQVAAFFDLPFRLYASTPQWVPPIERDARLVFDTHRHPFYRDSQAAFFLAQGNDGQALGRVAVLDNHRYNAFNQSRTAFFCLFECVNDLQVSQALFQAAFTWAKAQGLTRLSGPKGFSVFDGLGLLVEGFEHRPAFGLPYNPPYYAQLVEAAGFIRENELVSGYLDTSYQIPEKILTLVELLKKRRNLYVLPLRSRRDLRRIAPRLKDLYNASLGGTQGNVPISDEEVNALMKQMLWFADPGLIKIVMKEDEPVGFLLAYPDISAAVQRCKGKLFPLGWLTMWLELHRTTWININGAGMAEGFRGSGGTALLFVELYHSVKRSSYRHADIVQVGAENANMQRELQTLGITPYKIHRVYQRELTG